MLQTRRAPDLSVQDLQPAELATGRVRRDFRATRSRAGAIIIHVSYEAQAVGMRPSLSRGKLLEK